VSLDVVGAVFRLPASRISRFRLVVGMGLDAVGFDLRLVLLGLDPIALLFHCSLLS